MKWLQTLRLFALSFALSVTANIFGRQIAFTAIDHPYADSTQAWGINLRGDLESVRESFRTLRLYEQEVISCG
jgi:hypothetical protein